MPSYDNQGNCVATSQNLIQISKILENSQLKLALLEVRIFDFSLLKFGSPRQILVKDQ